MCGVECLSGLRREGMEPANIDPYPLEGSLCCVRYRASPMRCPNCGEGTYTVTKRRIGGDEKTSVQSPQAMRHYMNRVLIVEAALLQSLAHRRGDMPCTLFDGAYGGDRGKKGLDVVW